MYISQQHYSICADNIPLKNHKLTKVPVPVMRNFLPSGCSEESKWFSKQHSLLLLPLDASQSLKVSSYC